MNEVRIGFSEDAGVGLAAMSGFLAADPVRTERLGALVRMAASRGEAGRFWWVEDDSSVLGAAAAPADPGSTRAEVVLAVGSAGAALSPALSEARVREVRGPVDDLRALAGPAAVLEQPRLAMEVTEVRSPPPPEGSRTLAEEDEIDLLAGWLHEFDLETGTHPDDEFNRRLLQSYVRRGWLHVWRRGGELVATSSAFEPTPGVARLVFVYTPPGLRGQGFAARLVAEVAASVLSEGKQCVLYADPANPTAVDMYRRIGFAVHTHHATANL